jgi:hypothetical protein
VQEILSQHSKNNPQQNKSVIYQRAIAKKRPLDQKTTKNPNINGETRSLKQEEGADDARSKGVRSQMSHQSRAKSI